MNLKQYIAESEKTYNYRIKSLSDIRQNAAAIEQFLKRYNVISVQKPKKTILQKRPLDFPTVQNREVFMMDVTLGLPVSAYVVERELVGFLGLPGDYLVVRGENDPMEVQNDTSAQHADIAQQAEKKNLEASTLMSTESAYPEAEHGADGSNYFGDGYNSRLLKYLNELSTQRKEEEKVDAPAPLFSWLEMPKPDVVDGDFNKDIKKPDVKPLDKEARQPAKTGNYDDEGKTVKKTFINKDGKAKTIKGKPESIRKE